jgi:Cys-tRNA(Pro)/Cys-tRNA(Cys) deacylase
VAVIPGSHSLVYKALARASGNRKTTLLPLKELQATTGYLRGGCSPLGMRKAFPTFFDTSALQYEQIYVNAGKRGLLMKVAPQRLGELCEASFADIAQPMS